MFCHGAVQKKKQFSECLHCERRLNRMRYVKITYYGIIIIKNIKVGTGTRIPMEIYIMYLKLTQAQHLIFNTIRTALPRSLGKDIEKGRMAKCNIDI